MFAKRNHLTLGITALLFLVCINAAAEPATAGAPANPQLEGTWVVTVDLINPPPFLPEEFTALETYSRGGGMITSNNMLQGPGQGSWERSGNQYAATILFFTHDGAGALNGSIKVTHKITPSGRDAYSGQGTAEIFDPAGAFLGSVPFNTQASRLVPTAQ